MTAENFTFWLQGFFELNEADCATGPAGLTPAQAAMVRRHLSLVFVNKTAAPVWPPVQPSPYPSGVSIPYVAPRVGDLIATC